MNTKMKIFEILNIISKIFYGFTIIGCFMGGMVFITSINKATGAPQEAALAAMSLVFAVIPYCFARAFQEIIRKEENKKLADNEIK